MGVTGRWVQVEKDHLPVREISWAARGKGEEGLGRAGKKERAQCLAVLSLDFLKRKYSRA